ncbi:phosphotransferase [Bacillus sp. NTK071]|uniref:phosphotransferase enzyme family protein n=1 Tax=Bacillus sp. NTK071 TaxID=2802175 RepID=UPI001A8C75C4|nr:phosphotransferase [Bacillus sp. NTK071]MBN8209648.1 phosphotransferase [Bacillus sp. NTK071]
MEAWIDNLFSEAILEDVIKRFGIHADEKKKLGDFENYVYEVKQGNQTWILRLTHSSHRSIEEIQAELDWINELHRQGVNVSCSSFGQRVETIPLEQGSFYACLFDKAPGYIVKTDDLAFGPELFEAWGREVGKMHSISMNYQPAKGKRGRWDQGDLLRFEHYLTSSDDESIITSGERLVEEIKSFHETGKTFGLIHSDVHQGNFFYDGREIHLFDFDDSIYHYYSSDLAIPVYYAVWGKCGNESLQVRSAFATNFLYSFLKGYRKEATISNEWLRTIPFFLRLRDFELYTVFHKKFNVAFMKEKDEKALQGIRNRLINKELMADISFDSVMMKLENA